MRCSFLNGSLSILLSSLGSGFVVVESELYESVDFGEIEEIEDKFVLIWLDGDVADLIVVKPVLAADNVFHIDWIDHRKKSDKN